MVDSKDVVGIWDNRHYPAWYIPVDDLLVATKCTEEVRDQPGIGPVVVHDIDLGHRTLTGAALFPTEDALPAARNRVRIDFDAVDRWFEEDEQVISEPRNPYVRVDAIASSRHITVAHGDVVIADTTKPVLLFETGVATRYYIPAIDVSYAHLVEAERKTSCPYKGFASYFDVVVEGDRVAEAAWTYPAPLWTVAPIAGMVCFYTNKLSVEVDGVTVTT